jgi:hypothetical protein
MKAKDLAKILLENPEATVVFDEYIGCDTPVVDIGNVEVYKKGQKIQNFDGSCSKAVNYKDATCKTDVLRILSSK